MYLPQVFSLAPLLLLVVPAGDFKYAPEEGSKIQRVYTSVLEMELIEAEVEIVVDGEVQDAPQPEVEVSVRQESSQQVTDTFEKVADGNILVLTRAYEALSHSESVEVTVNGEEQDGQDSESESDLEGLTVRFTFDEESDEWKKAWFEDDEGDEDLLEYLEATTGYSFLLPLGEIAVGEEWELDDDEAVQGLRLLLDPLGELNMLGEEDDSEEELATAILFREGIETEEFLLQLKSMEDGQAVIVFKVEGSTEFERTPELPEEMQAMGMEVLEGFELALEIEGELVWDLAAQHMISLEYTSELEMLNSSTQSGSGPAGEVEITQSQSFEGEITFEVTLQ
jgi:hypothetical protein